MDVLVDSHILLDRAQKRRLRALAAERECSLALLVRRAVDHYLAVAAGPSAHQVRVTAMNAIGSLPAASTQRSDDGW